MSYVGYSVQKPEQKNFNLEKAARGSHVSGV